MLHQPWANADIFGRYNRRQMYLKPALIAKRCRGVPMIMHDGRYGTTTIERTR